VNPDVWFQINAATLSTLMSGILPYLKNNNLDGKHLVRNLIKAYAMGRIKIHKGGIKQIFALKKAMKELTAMEDLFAR
jgi:hypothetical protein